MEVKATRIKQVNDRQVLFELNVPVKFTRRYDDTPLEETRFVVSSFGKFALETYLFPADADGNILDLTEIAGSFRGELNHEKAIEGLIEHLEL